jgi:arsenate reductase
MKLKVLFICTHNSARSQMAEAFLDVFYPELYEVNSAGTEPGKINRYVVKVMAELGFDLSNNKAKSVTDFLDQDIDYVITVCNKAKETCPFFPGAKKYIHHSFSDPSGFTGSEKEILDQMRRVRDEIKNWVKETFGSDNDTGLVEPKLDINLG